MPILRAVLATSAEEVMPHRAEILQSQKVTYYIEMNIRKDIWKNIHLRDFSRHLDLPCQTLSHKFQLLSKAMTK